MIDERVVGERLELGQQLGAKLRGERRGDTNVMQLSGLVVQAEQQRANTVAVFVHSIASNHTLGGALVLHLDQRALVGRVEAAQTFGDNTIEARTFETIEPFVSHFGVGR